ncbi:MAG: hypothetical protein K2P14_07390 [Anaeroplasmataceae bacterium]|jgi:hypothetical protein|nr:hypothetical protein [Anaeroplasmataceae bacterium]
MICTNQYFNFENEVHMGEDLYTTYQGKELVLKEVYRYFGPVTMQYLPYGGIQSVFNYQLIITTKSGFITTDFVIYDGQEMPVKEFIEKFPDLVNEVLPS